jgi:hypothetical protein
MFLELTESINTCLFAPDKLPEEMFKEKSQVRAGFDFTISRGVQC